MSEPALTAKEFFTKRVNEIGCKNKEIAENYFIRLDRELKAASPVKTWNQVDFEGFLNKAIAYANIGIDPLAPDMLSFTLYSNKSGFQDVVFVESVGCMEILARRYGVNCPENIKVEVIYSTDEFTLVKKGLNNPEDTFVLDIKNPFDRGEIVGAVALSQYANPQHNKVRVLSLKDIESRVKTKTSNGQETAFWKNWKPEMCEKTIAKHAWGKVILNTTELADYYAAQATQVDAPQEYDNLPFTPEGEV